MAGIIIGEIVVIAMKAIINTTKMNTGKEAIQQRTIIN